MPVIMSKSDPEIRVDEILPPQNTAAPSARSSDPADRTVAHFLAKYLDELLRVPGTNFKIGLDPILALIPGLGDTLVSSAGAVILLDALRSGVPWTVFLRMALNMGINFLIGLIPGAGAAASAFFKSNSRNLALLTAWQVGQKERVRRSTLRFYLGLVFLGVMFAAFIIVGWLFYTWLLLTLLRSAGQVLTPS